MPSSPALKTWERPSGRIKLKVKKKKTSQCCSSAKNLNVLKPLNSNRQDGRPPSTKRKNPFGCSPPKKKALGINCDHKESEYQLFRALDGQKREDNLTENIGLDVSDLDLEPQNSKPKNDGTTMDREVGESVESTIKKAKRYSLWIGV
jgi:hypothetical protein